MFGLRQVCLQVPRAIRLVSIPQATARLSQIRTMSNIITTTDRGVIDSILKQKPITRNSPRESNAGSIINAIRSGDYATVKKLAQTSNIDGHDRGENTPLTDAAMRGDTQAVRFLIKECGANPHASCDCPHHKTALHYASENGHADTVKVLLECGANPLVKDSRNYTAAQVASNDEVKMVIRNHAESQSKRLGNPYAYVPIGGRVR
jgi:ankyrin repeat protein